MKVAKDLVVSLAYQVRTEDGVLVDESPVSAPLDYLHGHVHGAHDHHHDHDHDGCCGGHGHDHGHEHGGEGCCGGKGNGGCGCH